MTGAIGTRLALTRSGSGGTDPEIINMRSYGWIARVGLKMRGCLDRPGNVFGQKAKQVFPGKGPGPDQERMDAYVAQGPLTSATARPP